MKQKFIVLVSLLLLSCGEEISTNTSSKVTTTSTKSNKNKIVLFISAEPRDFLMNIGEKKKVICTVRYNDNTTDNDVTWISSNGGVVNYNKKTGEFEAIASGLATITAKSNVDSTISTDFDIFVNYPDGQKPIPQPVSNNNYPVFYSPTPTIAATSGVFLKPTPKPVSSISTKPTSNPSIKPASSTPLPAFVSGFMSIAPIPTPTPTRLPSIDPTPEITPSP